MAKKAVIGAIMHKLAHLIYGVIHTDKPFDAHYLAKGLAIQDGICPRPPGFSLMQIETAKAEIVYECLADPGLARYLPQLLNWKIV
ncbi:hypothetical protein ACQ4WY_26360 [Janthinobacterium sp. LB2P49]|uniref:hypothetical protein n=1 Tax=Janthinobacterium sp. LB2P49 TaxID=3424198 RepID=UPI003F2161A2